VTGDPRKRPSRRERKRISSTDGQRRDCEKRHKERIETMIKQSIEIHRPAEEVFAYLDQVDRHNKWQGRFLSHNCRESRPHALRYAGGRAP